MSTKISLKVEQEPIELYKFCVDELEKIDLALYPLYGESKNLYNHKIGVYKIFRRLLRNFHFLYNAKNYSNQQIVLTLSRMILDHYAILFLLSSYSSRKEQLLRYYLYLIESLSGRVKTIQDFSENLQNVSAEIAEQNSNSISQDLITIQEIVNKIKAENIDQLVDEKTIKKHNWRFPSNKPAGNKNMYSWQELYNIAKIPPKYSKSIQNHFSNFTHGLGTTILYLDDSPTSVNSCYQLLAVIQSLAGKLMITNYPKELENTNFDERFVELGDFGWNSWK